MLLSKKIIKFIAVFAFLQAVVLLFCYQKLSRANTDTFSVLEISNKTLEHFWEQSNDNRKIIIRKLRKDIHDDKIKRSYYQSVNNVAKKETQLKIVLDSLLQVLHNKQKISYSSKFQRSLKTYYKDLANILEEQDTPISKSYLDDLRMLEVNEREFSEMRTHTSVQENKLFLNKMKTDVLLANLMLVSYMCQETPDIIKPIFEANYILYNGNRIEQGETLEAQIYLSLRKSEPIEMIRVNGDTLQIDENGMAFYEKKADKLGTFPVKASITTKTGTGQNKTITGEIRYAVKKACR